MSPIQMLTRLSDLGDGWGYIYEDEIDGWFGWKIEGDVLEVTFENGDDDPESHKWRITPIY